MNPQAEAAHRLAIYRGLEARNRVVAILRVGVPALGAVALVALLVQIYVSSLGGRFGVGRISVTSESVTVETPEYAGTLEDGTAYRVSASAAQAATDATHLIDLSDAALLMTRPTGVAMTVDAAQATLDTSGQLVVVRDDARVANSQGTRGVIRDSVFDYVTQSLTGKGPVVIDYADGTHLVAEGMTYDAIGLVWTFTRATVTLPDTPGAREREDRQP